MGKLPVSVNADVDAEGAKSLIDAAVDAFSPATEGLGLIGDVVRLARVEVAARVTRRAKEIADKNGLKLTAPPLKFLAPFYEKASLEEPEDDQAIEMWSQLLVNSAVGEGQHPHFISILSELESDQAILLKDIFWARSKLHKVPSEADAALAEGLRPLNAILNEITDRDFEAIFGWATAKTDRPLDYALSGISKRFTGQGIFCDQLKIWSDSSPIGRLPSLSQAETDRHLRRLDTPDLDVLRALNLIERHVFSSKQIITDSAFASVVFQVTVYTLTPLSLQFLASVDCECGDYLTEQREIYEQRLKR